MIFLQMKTRLKRCLASLRTTFTYQHPKRTGARQDIWTFLKRSFASFREISKSHARHLLILWSFSLCGEEPEALYLTWTHDPCSTMTVQWITKKEDHVNTVVLLGKEGTPPALYEGTSHEMPQNMPYLIHWAEITNLSSDTNYTFTISGMNKNWTFKTAPKTLAELTFAVGGDTFQGKEDWFTATCKKIAEQNPLFIMMGGDLAYASPGKKEKDENGYRWLRWIKLYSEYAIGRDGNAIPLLVTIGNHDVKGHYNGTMNDAPFYYGFFAFPGAPGYNFLHFGDYMSIFFLDSNHTNPIGGAQTEWLENTLRKEQGLPNLFAIYHVPAYPSVRSFNLTESKEIRKHWVPLFEHYGLHVAFENHDHVFKRTYPLKGGVSDPSGVLYIGDGSWGVKPRVPKKAVTIPYLAKTASTRQFLKVTITPQGREFTSLSPAGDLVDHYVQLRHAE